MFGVFFWEFSALELKEIKSPSYIKVLDNAVFQIWILSGSINLLKYFLPGRGLWSHATTKELLSVTALGDGKSFFRDVALIVAVHAPVGNLYIHSYMGSINWT